MYSNKIVNYKSSILNYNLLRYLLLLSLLLLLGCSATPTISENSVKNKPKENSINERLAQDHFIKGAMYELKGEIHAAILEYQDALLLDEQAGIHNVLSKNYLTLHKLTPALKHSRMAVKLEPDDVEYNFLLGSIFRIAQKPDSAEKYFERVIELDSLYFLAYYSLAQLNEVNRPLKSLEIYNRLLKLTGLEWSVLVKIAELNERLGNVDSTINTIEKLLELDPSNLELQKLLIKSYLKIDNNDEALLLVDDALVLFPDDLTLIEYRGNIKANKNKWEEATLEYKKLVRSSEISFEVKKKIAGSFVAEAARDSSIVPLAKNLIHELAKDSTDWHVNTLLGEISLKEDEDSVAIQYFQNALQLAPWNLQLWNRVGILLFESQKFEEAVSQMKNAVSKFPDDFIINLILGLSLSQQKDIEGASQALAQAVRLNPNDLTALHAYGFTLNQLGQDDAALIFLGRALDIDSNNVQVIATMGLIYDSMEKFEISDSLYKRALLIDSTNALISNNYAYSLAERDVKLDKALKLSKFAVEQEPKNASFLDTIGWVHFKLGNYNKALKFIKKAIIEDDSNAILMDHLADVYYKLNDKENAIKYWGKALEIDPTIDGVNEKLDMNGGK